MKDFSVRINRLNHMENMRSSEIREQISLRPCTVRLQRYNSDLLNNYDASSTASGCSATDGVGGGSSGGTLALNHGRVIKKKLKRCCIRVQRLNYIPTSRLSSTD